jgi:hypothetical protein
MKRLIDKLIKEGGSIVCSSSLSVEDIRQATATNRFYVDNDGIGFVWIPDTGFLLPETIEQVEAFEKYYPLMPENYQYVEDFAKKIWDNHIKNEEEIRLSRLN